MEPTTPTIPLDVITEVINHLESNSDVTTLNALSTTCSALRRPSERKLFQKLAILIVPPSNAEPRPACFALSDLFNASPHLATYIRDLTVTFNNPDPATSIGISVLEKLSSIVSLRIDRHLCTELSWSFGPIGDAKVPTLFVPFPLVVLQNRLSDDLNCIIAVALCSRSPGSLLRILRLCLCLPHSPPR